MPAEGLLSKEYARARRGLIDPTRAWPEMPPPWDDLPPFDDFEEPAQKKTEPVRAEAPAGATRPAEPEPEPARPPVPVPALEWDGDWPTLASALPVRGVVHQLAQQSELLECVQEGDTFLFKLRGGRENKSPPAPLATQRRDGLRRVRHHETRAEAV